MKRFEVKSFEVTKPENTMCRDLCVCSAMFHPSYFPFTNINISCKLAVFTNVQKQ